MRTRLDRRGFLRGCLASGAAVCVGTPLLEIFLDGNGEALASGKPIPPRFGTWFWGNGMNPERWNPTETGREFALGPELEPLTALRDDLTIFSNFDARLGNRSNQVHFSGFMGTLTGSVPAVSESSIFPTLDVRISDQIGLETRFKSLEMTAPGNPRQIYSERNQNSLNPAEPNALALYRRVFGPGFSEPGTGNWAPDTETLLRKSALSVVADDRRRLEKKLGRQDALRLEEYFTSLRQIERQLAIQLKEPEPRSACKQPAEPTESETSPMLSDIERNHAQMAEVLALALACDQTRVFNMVFTPAASAAYIPGGSANHHVLTHTEPRDPDAGYQVEAGEFVLRSMKGLALFLETLKNIQEGNGTLLDNCLVMAHSEHSQASTHDIRGLPVLFAGKAGGRILPGLHVDGARDPVTRIGLTAQHVMGLEAGEFGRGPNRTTQPVNEIRA